MPTPLPAARRPLPRRRFLAGGLSVAALVAGCSAPAGQAPAPTRHRGACRTSTARRRSRRTRGGW
jgi:anti-sigma factor RsiW